MPEEIHLLTIPPGHVSHARLRITRPPASVTPLGACILLNSGRVAQFDGAQDEVVLYGKVGAALNARGTTCFEIDFPERELGPGTTDAAIALRLERLDWLMAHQAFAPFRSAFSILAMSLGGQVALRYMADASCGQLSPDLVVLIGTVIEAPVIVNTPVKLIHLVYGENDFIGYVSDGDEQVALHGPHDYALQSRERLVVRRSQTVMSHILRGCGHTLRPVQLDSEDAVEQLVTLLTDAARVQPGSTMESVAPCL